MMQSSRGSGRFFSNLKVRPKLMVLHNLFFLVLTCGVYYSLIPMFERQVESAWRREEKLATRMFAEDAPLLEAPGLGAYEYREGTADEAGLPEEARRWLEERPGAIWHSPDGATLFRQSPRQGLYRRLHLPVQIYGELVARAKRTLFLVLGVIYVLAVLTLECFVMPLYAYRPLRLLLEADRATRQGDRAREMIDESYLTRDEIGEIMRSRNATVAELRRHEDELERALEDVRRKNQLLESAKRSLAEQDRLASLGLLSAGVAHELNTPLSVLRGSIEKMLETAAGDTAITDRLNRMLRVTQRLQKISEALVDFSRSRKQQVEPVPLRPVIEECWQLLAINPKAASVRFENRVREGHAVTGNADRLAQVFVNLLRNALHAAPLGGRIEVESRVFEEEGRPWVSVTVEDDGPGIPPDVLPDIFEAFVTTRLDARGTGLGLTVAEGIVHQHGGRIGASNRPGGGARLEVRLPAAPMTKTDLRSQEGADAAHRAGLD